MRFCTGCLYEVSREVSAPKGIVCAHPKTRESASGLIIVHQGAVAFEAPEWCPLPTVKDAGR